MKKNFGIFLFILLMLIMPCYALKSFKVLVIPSNLFEDYTNYMIYSKSDELIANDIVNIYKKNAIMSAPSVSYVKEVLNQPQNIKLKKSTVKLLNNYRTNYSINFSDVQKLSSKFKINNVLLITTTMDAQNYFMRRTFWDFVNIPGATTIDPAYRLSTQVTLIDANNQIILWQQNFQKLISSRENRIIPEAFSPNTEQLEKVKRYSTKFLAPQVVQETQLALLNMSPYQNLNIHPEIVKPNNISIDKVKIDSKRTSVRAGKAAKAAGMATGAGVASLAGKVVGKSAKQLSKTKNNVNIPKINSKKLQNATKKTITNTQQNINNLKKDVQNNTNNIKQNVNKTVEQTKSQTKQIVNTQNSKKLETTKAASPNKAVKQNNNKAVEQKKTTSSVNQTQKQNDNKTVESKKTIAPVNKTVEQDTKNNVKENLQKEKDINTILKENNIQTKTKTIILSPLDNADNIKPYIRISPEIKETNYTINDL